MMLITIILSLAIIFTLSTKVLFVYILVTIFEHKTGSTIILLNVYFQNLSKTVSFSGD